MFILGRLEWEHCKHGNWHGDARRPGTARLWSRWLLQFADSSRDRSAVRSQHVHPPRIRVYADQRCDPGGRAEASRSKGCARNVCAFDSIRYETLRLPRRINMLNISTLHECWIGWYRAGLRSGRGVCARACRRAAARFSQRPTQVAVVAETISSSTSASANGAREFAALRSLRKLSQVAAKLGRRVAPSICRTIQELRIRHAWTCSVRNQGAVLGEQQFTCQSHVEPTRPGFTRARVLHLPVCERITISKRTFIEDYMGGGNDPR